MSEKSSAKLDGNDTRKIELPLWEFVALVASLMSLNALAIDIMLPALGEIFQHYDLNDENDQQLVIFAYVVGFGFPQLIFGPITDRFGRKGLLQICLIGYAIAAIGCVATSSFAFLLVTRFVQGVFASGVRVIAGSIVRDRFSGRAMARIMSLIMTVFMVVPIIAPMLGSAVMLVLPWPWVFVVLMLASLLVLIWVHFRLSETLLPANRQAISPAQIFAGYRQVVCSRVTLGYMSASGIIFGSLFAYIAASKQIFADVFGQEQTFALWFGGIAAGLAAASLFNSAIVERVGMRRISHAVLLGFIVLSVLNMIGMALVGETLWIFYPLFTLMFACFGMIGSNFLSLALEPLGNIAGTANASYGFATTTVAGGFGWLVARQYDGSTVPVLLGFVGLGVASLVIVLVTERGRLFRTS